MRVPDIHIFIYKLYTCIANKGTQAIHKKPHKKTGGLKNG